MPGRHIVQSLHLATRGRPLTPVCQNEGTRACDLHLAIRETRNFIFVSFSSSFNHSLTSRCCSFNLYHSPFFLFHLSSFLFLISCLLSLLFLSSFPSFLSFFTHSFFIFSVPFIFPFPFIFFLFFLQSTSLLSFPSHFPHTFLFVSSFIPYSTSFRHSLPPMFAARRLALNILAPSLLPFLPHKSFLTGAILPQKDAILTTPSPSPLPAHLHSISLFLRFFSDVPFLYSYF